MTMTSAVMMAETKERLRKSKMYRMCLRAKKWRQGKEGENQCNKRHTVRVRLVWDLMMGQNERVCLSVHCEERKFCVWAA